MRSIGFNIGLNTLGAGGGVTPLEFDDRTEAQTFSFIGSPAPIAKTWCDAGYPTVRVEKGWGSGVYSDLYPDLTGALWTGVYGSGQSVTDWAGSDKLLVERIYNQSGSDPASDYVTAISDSRRVLLDISVATAPCFAGYATGTQDANQHATERGYELPHTITLQTNDHPLSLLAIHQHDTVGTDTVGIVQNDATGTPSWLLQNNPSRHYPSWAIVVRLIDQPAIPGLVQAVARAPNAGTVSSWFTQSVGQNGVFYAGFGFFSASASSYTLNIFGSSNSLQGRCYALMIAESELSHASMLFDGIPSKTAPIYANAIETDKPSIAFPYDNAVIPMDLSTETADIPIRLFGKPSTEYQAQWQSGGYSSIGTTDANGVLDGALSSQSKGNGTLDIREVGGSTPISFSNVAVGIVVLAMGESGADGRGAYVNVTIPTGSLRKDRANWTGSQGLATADVSAAGTGYSVSDVLTLSGGTGTAGRVVVTSVGGSGEVTGVEPDTANLGLYSAVPSNPASTTGGGGSGATITATYGTSKEWWKLLLQGLYDEFSCVIGVSRTAVGSSYLRNGGTKGMWSAEPAVLSEGSMAGRERALAMQADFLTPNFWIWDIGKNDAALQTAEAAFESEFTALLTYYRSSLGNANLKFWHILSGDNGSVSATYTDAIRQAQKDLWETSGFEPLGSFAHLEGDLDGTHFGSQAQKQIAADVAYRHLRGNGRAPQYSSGLISGSDVVLTFTGGVSPLTKTGTLATDILGFDISDDNGTRTITATAISGLELTLTCDQALVGTVSVQFASGDTSIGGGIVDGDGTTPLPPEPFGPVDIEV